MRSRDQRLSEDDSADPVPSIGDELAMLRPVRRASAHVNDIFTYAVLHRARRGDEARRSPAAPHHGATRLTALPSGSARHPSVIERHSAARVGREDVGEHRISLQGDLVIAKSAVRQVFPEVFDDLGFHLGLGGSFFAPVVDL